MSVIATKVTPVQTMDEGGTNQARWSFNDEFQQPVSISDLTIFSIPGRTAEDWDFDINYPNAINITYDAVIEPGMGWSMAASAADTKLVFETHDPVVASSGLTVEDPIILNLRFSADHDMGNGPAPLEGLKFNSSNLTLVTTANIYNTDLNSHPTDDAIPPYSKFRIEKASNPSVFAEYSIDGITDPQFEPPPFPDSGYRQLALGYTIGSGTLSDSDLVTVKLFRYGS